MNPFVFIEKLRGYWFYSTLLLQIGLSLTICALIPIELQRGERDYIGREKPKYTALYAPCSMCLVNSIYLATYGFLYTKTIFGSFVIQQAISIVIVALYVGLEGLGRFYFLQHTLLGVWGLGVASAAIQGLITLIFCALFVLARLSGDSLLGHWSVNLEDLATLSEPISTEEVISWRGIRRHQGRVPRRGRVVQSMFMFLVNSVSRRVYPVETKLYAFVQHIFSLAALAFLLTRTIVLLTQLGNEALPSRAVIVPWEVSSLDEGYISILIRYYDYGPDRGKMNRGIAITPFNISIAYQLNSTSSVRNSTNLCDVRRIQTLYRPSPGVVDEFWYHTCNRARFTSKWSDSFGFGFQYTMTTQRSFKDSLWFRVPEIWLVMGAQDPDLRTPYYATPIRPVREMHTVYDTHYALRRSISSSPLWDAVSGSKPRYDTVSLYPASPVYSRPLPANQSIGRLPLYSSGFIAMPTYLVSSPQTSQSNFEPGAAGPEYLMEVTEEYRVGSSFDILASIGGLFALLQGVHLFLFGRPLFWGMLGTKLITPFGFVGRFATRDFRQRLNERYFPPGSPPSLAANKPDIQTNNNMHITQFLLDYVIDLGPASATGQDVRAPQADLDSTCVQVELGEINRSKGSLS